MRKWDLLMAVVIWGTFAAILASALLLYAVWHEQRMILHLMNGGCLP